LSLECIFEVHPLIKKVLKQALEEKVTTDEIGMEEAKAVSGDVEANEAGYVDDEEEAKATIFRVLSLHVTATWWMIPKKMPIFWEPQVQ
jgi:hypothetical protein